MRRRRRRQVKTNLQFTSEIRDSLDLFGTPMALKTCLSQICNDGVQFQMKKRKISRGRPRSVHDAEGRQRNVQKNARTSTAIW